MIQVGILLLLCTGAFAQVPGLKACSDVKAMQNFNSTSYVGDWYQIEEYSSSPKMLEKCISATYMQNSDGTTKIIYRQTNILTNKPAEVQGSASPTNYANEAKFLVTFPGIPPSTYWILDTDYEKYEVQLTCNDAAAAKGIRYWIWGRQRELPGLVLKKAHDVLDKYNLSRNALKTTDQKHCPGNFQNY